MNSCEYEIRYRLLKILSEDSSLTQREMSRPMGISLGKLNYCLSELAKRGFVKIYPLASFLVIRRTLFRSLSIRAQNASRI
ncbi:MAG: winged helix-turn-helix transcriptional regulator [Deltaproteobacteria bacterium]|nr:winged helix-turn-helix transcriptional regulator [Deltaproteobacteria bacterium]